jgi:hypothetical protein
MALAAGGWAAVQAQDNQHLAGLLRAGACVVLLRHAQTEPGIGDPPGYRLDQCSSQRNLSKEGREQARGIGQWFAERQLKPAAVWSSPWCRCKDTAELAFVTDRPSVAVTGFGVLPALGSSFDKPEEREAQSRSLRARLKTVGAGQFEVWVTHQVNITALTGVIPVMGEAVILSAGARVVGQSRFN